MNYGNKKVLVTGATGLIGKELIKPLKQLGFDIYAITIDENIPDNGVKWIKGNLFDEKFIAETLKEISPEYLLNMAWCTTGNYLSSDVNFKFLTTGINLLKAFKDNGGKRAVFAGTCLEYKFKNKFLKETDLLDPEKTVYTFCKNKLHEIAEYFCKINEISFGYGRIFYVYGKNENKTRLTGMVIDNLKNDKEVVIKSGSLIKDYMYAKDIAGAFAKFLYSNVEGTVNICTNVGISIKDYVLKLAKIIGKEHLVIFKEEESSQPPLIVGNNKKLIKEVQYNIEYSLEKGFKEIING